MTFPAAFASIANGFAAQYGARYADGVVVTTLPAETDIGGSIVAPVEPIRQSCRVQIDAVTQAMRAAEGYQDRDVRLLILAHGLTGEIVNGNRVETASGAWLVQSVTRDPVGVYFDCRARAA